MMKPVLLVEDHNYKVNLQQSDKNDYIEFSMTNELTMFQGKTFPCYSRSSIKLHSAIIFFIIFFRMSEVN